MANNKEDAKSKAALELLKSDLEHHGRLSTALSGLIQTSLRVSFLLNGAAIIAALSVYGAKGTSSGLPIKPMGVAILFWVVGLVASALSTGLYTRAQREFQVAAGETARERANKHFNLDLPNEKTGASDLGRRLRKGAINAWAMSIIAFCGGAVVITLCAFFA